MNKTMIFFSQMAYYTNVKGKGKLFQLDRFMSTNPTFDLSLTSRRNKSSQLALVVVAIFYSMQRALLDSSKLITQALFLYRSVTDDLAHMTACRTFT